MITYEDIAAIGKKDSESDSDPRETFTEDFDVDVEAAKRFATAGADYALEQLVFGADPYDLFFSSIVAGLRMGLLIEQQRKVEVA